MLSSKLLNAFLFTLSLFTLCLGAPAVDEKRQSAWPDTPFTANGRDIVSASGRKIVYAGINWSGHGETMLPEGLQYNSIANIVSRIKELGMNVVRLTYAIEMVDDYLGNSPNQGLRNTLVHALGQQSGSRLLRQILTNNPQFNEGTTRLQVFDAVAAELAKQQVWVHLDNHVSQAKWCCSETDGNAWFGDLNFPAYQWQRGLGFMANHAKSWTALSSISLRNELRAPRSQGNSAAPYNWANWYRNAVPATQIINGYDTDNTALVNGQHLGEGLYFNLNDFSYKNKLVFELHNYQNGASSCSEITPGLYRNGYGAMNLSDPAFPNHAPVVMTEFGYEQSSGTDKTAYAQCLKSFLTTGQPGGPGGWTQWVLSGSYYIRTGTQDYDETWALLNHNWSGWRNQAIIDNYVKPFVRATLG